MKRIIAGLIAALLIADPAVAASKSPTPAPTKKSTATPSVKATTKVTAKATLKATVKPTAKATVKASVRATPTKKAVVKKPVVKRSYKPRPKVKLSPSPSPLWPPKGYVQNGDIYAKIPTSKELIGWTSSTARLSAELKQCETLTCGALLAASLAGCKWWEFNADVVGPTSDTDSTEFKYGSLTTLYGASKPKQIIPFIMISEEPIKTGFKLSGIKVACHREAIPTDLKVPSNTYVKTT